MGENIPQKQSWAEKPFLERLGIVLGILASIVAIVGGIYFLWDRYGPSVPDDAIEVTTAGEITTDAVTPLVAQSSITVNDTYLPRLALSFGELKKLLQDPEYEFTHATRYEVWGSEADVSYRFKGHVNEYSGEWTTDDDDLCFTIISTVKKILPSVKSSITVDELSVALGLSYEIFNGFGTLYYIADRFVEIMLPRSKSYETRIYLLIALENGDIITPDSEVWLVASSIQ